MGGAEDGISGRLVEAASSRFTSAHLSHLDGVFRLQVPSDRRDITWGQDVCRISDPVAGLPRRFSFPDGSAFEADPSGELDAFVGALNISSGWSWALKAKPKLMVATVVAAILFPFAIWFGFPVIADAIAVSLPRGVTAEIGTQALSSLDRGVLGPSEMPATQRREAEAILDELVAAAGLPYGSVQLEFRKGDVIGPNGLALPGGIIIMTDELFALSEHPDEIAGVLAHELGHVEKQHGTKKIVRAVGLLFLVQFLIGDTVSLIEEAASAGASVIGFSYSRDFELEADARSVQLMKAVGRDPRKMFDLLHRIFTKFEIDPDAKASFLSTHPGLKERLDALRDR